MGTPIHGKDGEWMETVLDRQKYWRSSIAHTFMEWGRACWSHRNSTLYGKRKDQYKITRMRLKAEAQVWMDAPNVETLIPIQRDRWKRKVLKKAANSDIAFWLVHNRTRRRIVQRGKVPNIVITLTSSDDLAAANTRFITKIAKAKQTTLQDGRRDEGPPDQDDRNEEPPPDKISRG